MLEWEIPRESTLDLKRRAIDGRAEAGYHVEIDQAFFLYPLDHCGPRFEHLVRYGVVVVVMISVYHSFTTSYPGCN